MGESGKLRLEDLLGGLAPRGTVKLDERGGPPAITFGIDRRTATEDDRTQAEEFAVWIEERLARGSGVKSGVGLEMLRLAGPRTQDVIQVARQLYFRGLAARRKVEVADVETSVKDVVGNETPLLRSLWNDLSPQQQDVLRVVALGVEQLYSSEVRDQYGLPAGSSVHKAVEALTARGLLLKEGDRVVFDSPFFLHWVRSAVAPDLR